MRCGSLSSEISLGSLPEKYLEMLPDVGTVQVRNPEV